MSEKDQSAKKTELVSSEKASASVVSNDDITASDLLKNELSEVKVRKARKSKNISKGICHIRATSTNTHVTFTDEKGNVVSWSKAGRCGFRGSRKSTGYAAQMATQAAGQEAVSHGMKEVSVHVRGIGLGRDSAIKTIPSLGLVATEILELTPIPHGGCRAPKSRRA